MAQATTIDGLLDRRVTLEQPAQGYRVAVDTVLLAASVPAASGQTALDLGCGVGGAMLSLACRVPDLSITGIEIQPDLAELCQRNIGRNAFAVSCAVESGDIANLDISAGFDHAFMNPPYHEEKRHDVSPNAQKKTANAEKTGDLKIWIEAAAKVLRPNATLTLIHRADRQDEILDLLKPLCGATELLPIIPKAGSPPKRLIVRARKGAPATLTPCESLVLHGADGKYTEAAEDILRHMKLLRFVPTE